MDRWISKAALWGLICGAAIAMTLAPAWVAAAATSFDAYDWHVRDRLGIGTLTPGYPLHVYHPTVGTAIAVSDSIGDALSLYTDGAASGTLWLKGDGSNTVKLTGEGDSYITAGNLGIGTESPTHTLDIDGTGRFTGALTIGAYTLPSTDGGNLQVLATDGNGTVGWKTLSGGETVWNLHGNAMTTPGTDFLGTTDGRVFMIKVGGRQAFLFRPDLAGICPNLIGGFEDNSVRLAISGATISGGGKPEYSNEVTDAFGTIGGGSGNQAGNKSGTGSDASYATVSGGEHNVASGEHAAVGGGKANVAGGGWSTAPGGYVNHAFGHFSSIGGGSQNAANGTYAAIAGGSWNVAAAENATIGGGLDNQANSAGATVGGGRKNQSNGEDAVVAGGSENAANGPYVSIGGGAENEAAGSASYGTIAGGRYNDVGDSYATVSGGYQNIASGFVSTISGGGYNTASDAGAIGGGTSNSATGRYATIGGGFSNDASGEQSTIAGGLGNDVASSYSAIGGGAANYVSGHCATIPGGYECTAEGDYSIATGYQCIAEGDHSFAGGYKASANEDGSFVWSDNSSVDSLFGESEGFYAFAENSFCVRATGGVVFVSEVKTEEEIRDGIIIPDMYTGVQLKPGAASWSRMSDKEAKDILAEVDGRDVLARLSTIPVTSWSLKSQDPSIRHIGPMAQDLYAAFGYGEDERYINGSDVDGIALVSIQALYELSQEKDAEIAAQQDQIDDLRAEIEALKEAIAAKE